MPGEDGGAGVALLLGVAPIALVAGKVQLDLPLLELGLLQADEIGVKAPEDLLEALFLHGAQAVHIPGNESHFVSSRRIR